LLSVVRALPYRHLRAMPSCPSTEPMRACPATHASWTEAAGYVPHAHTRDTAHMPRQATGVHGGPLGVRTDGVAVLAQSLSDVFADGPCGMVGFM
jgi:hypothetical protein